MTFGYNKRREKADEIYFLNELCSLQDDAFSGQPQPVEPPRRHGRPEVRLLLNKSISLIIQHSDYQRPPYNSYGVSYTHHNLAAP